MIRFSKKAICALIALLMAITFVGCDNNGDPAVTDNGGYTPPPLSTGDETDPVDTEKIETEPVVPETTVNIPEPEKFYSYLTGYEITEEEQKQRPVAIMLNNIWTAIPQIGISAGEVYYECAAEGGITRVMMVLNNYDKVGTIGSIRSSRDYFVDFLDNHDALYVHAGGSDQAYSKIIWRKTNNLDAVTMYLPNVFWRDENRLATMGYEHSMMTSGEAIATEFKNKEYRLELNDNYTPIFNFCLPEEEIVLGTEPANHIHINTTAVQTVDYVYDKETREYLRYQYNGDAHIDGATGEQISVKNVIILFTDISVIPGDTAGRLTVETVGEGRGYYITNGEVKEIKWSRSHNRAAIDMKYADGTELVVNCGKTFINVVDYSVERTLGFNYEW